MRCQRIILLSIVALLTKITLIPVFYPAYPVETDETETVSQTLFVIDPPHITQRRMIPYARTVERMHDLPMPRLHKLAAYSPQPLVHLGIPVNFVFEMEAASMPQCFHHAVPTTKRIVKRDLFPGTDLTIPEDYDYGKFKAFVKNTDHGDLEGFVHVALVWGEQLRVPNLCRRSMIGLAEGIRTYTCLDVTVDSHLMLSSPRIHDYPMIVITSDSAFELTQTERDNLRTYIENGGFLFVDNARPEFPRSQAEASLRQMIRDVLGCHARFEALLPEHDICHSYFDFNDGPPAGKENQLFSTETWWGGAGIPYHLYNHNEYSYYMEGIHYNDRLVIVYSDRGYAQLWGERIIKYNNGYNPETLYIPSAPQLKFGVNLMLYALKRHILQLPKYDIIMTD